MDKQIAELRELARGDIARTLTFNTALNVFSLPCTRHTWQQGFDNVRPANMVDGSGEWRHWMRGRQVAILQAQPVQMRMGDSVRYGKNCRAQFDPSWSPSRPWNVFVNGTATNCLETLADADEYMRKLGAVRVTHLDYI